MLTKIWTCLAALSLFATLSYCVVAQSATVTVHVVDETGAAVPGASITLVATSGTTVKSATRADGTFDVPSDLSGTIRIEAADLARFETTADQKMPREMILRPSALSATVSVTGSETRIDETAASVTALDRENLDAAAAVTIDDKLRQAPGFSL